VFCEETNAKRLQQRIAELLKREACALERATSTGSRLVEKEREVCELLGKLQREISRNLALELELERKTKALNVIEERVGHGPMANALAQCHSTQNMHMHARSNSVSLPPCPTMVGSSSPMSTLNGFLRPPKRVVKVNVRDAKLFNPTASGEVVSPEGNHQESARSLHGTTSSSSSGDTSMSVDTMSQNGAVGDVML